MADQVHIDEVTAQAALYSIGALSKEEAAGFEKRLSAGCPLCGSELEECNKVVAALPLSAPETPPPPSLRKRLMDSIGAGAPKPAEAELLVVRDGSTEWKSIGPGVEIRSLYKKKTMLVRMAPGSILPEHDHNAAEQCLVLEGSVSNGEVTVTAGDFTYMAAGTHHDQLFSTDGCLLLIAYT